MRSSFKFLKKLSTSFFLFIDNLQNTLSQSKKKTVNIIVSKSGNTIETIANSNLIANWNCFSNDYQASGDSLYDYSGNGTNLSLNNFNVYDDKQNGFKVNNTLLYFDGTDHYAEEVLTSGNYFYDNFNHSNFTITCWVYNMDGSSNNGIFTIFFTMPNN